MRGGQWQVLRLVQGLSESTLLAPMGSPLFQAAAKAGLHVEPAGLLRAAVLARRYDLVHAHDSRSHTLAALVGGAPLIVSRRVAFGWQAKAPAPQGCGAAKAGQALPPANSPRPNWKYRRPTRYIAVSEFVKSVLAARGVPSEKIDVVYDGVPLLAPAAQLNRIVAPANTHDPRKGAALALEAARIAGVEILLSDNLERDLPGASLFLYITHSEGLGSGVLLAMSAGVPVLASNIGGLPEIISHRENGLLVENEPGAIAAAIRRLRADPALAAALGRAGRQTVIDRFTVERMVSRTMEVYRQALK